MKIVTVVGARPQFIKAAVVSRAIQCQRDMEEVVIHTGQHFDTDMSDIFFEQMNIPQPTYKMGVSSLSHGAMTGRMLEQIETILLQERPEWVLVYGDTNSTLAGALAASKLHIKVAHVEAGLRSFKMTMPEEQNRVLTDRLSRVLLCPTDEAMQNLFDEGYKDRNYDIINCGDVMFDASLYYDKKCRPPECWAQLELNQYVLATVHRAENTDSIERMTNIVDALNQIHSHIPVVLPLHPRTKKMLKQHGLKLNVHCIPPVGYLEMIFLLKHCEMVASDSGGVQKEAYFFGKNCLTLRDETEWMELVNAGVNVLTGACYVKIVDQFSNLRETGFRFSANKQLYGDGNAASKIVSYLQAGKAVNHNT